MSDRPKMVEVHDPTRPLKLVWLTETELPLVNQIRIEKGLSPLKVFEPFKTAERTT